MIDPDWHRRHEFGWYFCKDQQQIAYFEYLHTDAPIHKFKVHPLIEVDECWTSIRKVSEAEMVPGCEYMLVNTCKGFRIKNEEFFVHISQDDECVNLKDNSPPVETSLFDLIKRKFFSKEPYSVTTHRRRK